MREKHKKFMRKWQRCTKIFISAVTLP